MNFSAGTVAVLALHWQVNVIKPEGFFGGMLAEPVAKSGVVGRAAKFHAAARRLGVPIVFTRFTVPVGEGALVRNTGFMHAVGDAQDSFRPDGHGAALISEMLPLASADLVVDNQRLSGLAANGLPKLFADRGVTTLLVTGVATNLTVEQTARHGTDLGFTVHPITDCTAAASDEIHHASLADLSLVTAGPLPAAQALALLSPS